MCEECRNCDDVKWRIFTNYLDKLEKTRHRKVAARAEARASVSSTPRLALSTPVMTRSPVPTSLALPTTLLPGSLPSEPSAIASLEARIDKKFDALVNMVIK